MKRKNQDRNSVLKEFFTYYLHQKKTVALIFLLTASGLILDMISPLLIKQVLDILEAAGRKSNLSCVIGYDAIVLCTKYGIVLFFVYLAGQLISYGRAFYSQVLMVEMAYNLKSRFLSKLFNSASGVSEFRTMGALLLIFEQDTAAVSSFCQQFLFGMIMNSFHLAGLLIFVFYLNYELALTGSVVLLIYLLIIRFSRKKLESTSRLLRTLRIRMDSFVYERIAHALKIKILNREKQEHHAISEVFSGYRHRLYRIYLFHGLIEQLKEFCGVFGNLLILMFGGYAVILGKITIGTLIAFNNYFSRIYRPATTLLNLKLDYHKVLISFRRIGDFFSLADEEEEDREKIRITGVKRISVQDLEFGFCDQNSLQKGLNFEITGGEAVCFCGGNGTGKSSLALMLAGFNLKNIRSGKIMIDDAEIRNISRSSLRAEIAYFPQKNELFRTTTGELLENSVTGTDAAVKRIKNLGLYELIEKKGMDFQIQENGKNLSGGECQRMCMIETIISSPEGHDVYIMDEIESAQDRENLEMIENLIIRLKKEGKAVILISHRDEFSHLIDRQVIFR